jgi:dUTP pyrophosphatase
MEKLRVKRFSPDAVLPKRATPGSCGYDLHAAEGCVIDRNDKQIVRLDLAVAIPAGYYGRIAPRSSLAAKHIDVGAGVVDSDYRGDVRVVLFNLSSTETYIVKKGDRIAQLILEKVTTPEVEEVSDLPPYGGVDQTRGEGGFGSTGK